VTTPLAISTVDLARTQFATTSIYHFLFVPLTLGLAPLVAVMQTIWHRTKDERWVRLTRFFGTLLLINFVIGVATGLVQEFQFGMNWSVYSRFVGDVFGAPLAIEGLAAFMLEAVFLGLWLFGWNRLAPRLHLATIWIVAFGTWLSAFFILVANSWMQHPVGYKMVGGKAELTDFGALITNDFALRAWLHTTLAGLTMASMFVLGIACWHLLRGRSIDVFKKAAALALIVAVPVTIVNMTVGSRFGMAVTSAQGMKIAAAEALWDTEKPASFSLFQIGGFSDSDQKASFSLDVPYLLSYLSTGNLHSEVKGLNELQTESEQKYGPGDYTPPVRTIYWAMRVMAYLGALMVLVALVGAWLYRTRRLESSRWFLKTSVVAISFPFIAATAGWVLTEVGRQPWIVQGLLKTADARSPNVSSTMIGVSLGVFIALYAALGVIDFVLMRKYARLGPPAASAVPEEPPVPAMSY
jgi:cytochrome bd ubiquinol oxidase subunit I